MSREIKFRAWHKEQEMMLTVEVISFEGAENGIGHKEEYEYLEEVIEVYSRYEKTRWSDLKDVILMQYTGLKDKNGKEIYEGDLLKNGGNNPPAEVNYKDGCFFAGRYGCELWGYAGDIKEIIGNIYENPDLLSTSQE